MVNVTDNLGDALIDLVGRVDSIVTILKAAGIIAFIYVLYLIVRAVLSWKNKNRIKRIEQKVYEIDKKLDEVLGKSKNKKKKK